MTSESFQVKRLVCTNFTDTFQFNSKGMLDFLQSQYVTIIIVMQTHIRNFCFLYETRSHFRKTTNK